MDNSSLGLRTWSCLYLGSQAHSGIDEVHWSIHGNIPSIRKLFDLWSFCKISGSALPDVEELGVEAMA